MPIVTIILLSVAAVIILFILVVVAGFKLLHKMLSSQDEASSGAEARLLQDINGKLNKLEKRIESLETIVTATERGPRS